LLLRWLLNENENDDCITWRCLLFADDLLILSETKEGLQHSLNNLSNYCDNWQLDINVNKTKSMIITDKLFNEVV
jgi:hypothetical protein